MNTPLLSQRLEEWAAEKLGINTFDHMAGSLGTQLPVVICEMQEDRRVNQDARLPGFGAYQQTYVRARRARLLLLVEPEPSEGATDTLQGYVDTLAQSILQDVTLEGRVPTVSPLYDASYNPPVVRHSDGTVARAATFDFTIGETQGA